VHSERARSLDIVYKKQPFKVCEKIYLMSTKSRLESLETPEVHSERGLDMVCKIHLFKHLQKAKKSKKKSLKREDSYAYAKLN
jgi:hypothetical protein